MVEKMEARIRELELEKRIAELELEVARLRAHAREVVPVYPIYPTYPLPWYPTTPWWAPVYPLTPQITWGSDSWSMTPWTTASLEVS